jgi:hypothetical protein
MMGCCRLVRRRQDCHSVPMNVAAAAGDVLERPLFSARRQLTRLHGHAGSGRTGGLAPLAFTRTVPDIRLLGYVSTQ